MLGVGETLVLDLPAEITSFGEEPGYICMRCSGETVKGRLNGKGLPKRLKMHNGAILGSGRAILSWWTLSKEEFFHVQAILV